MKIRDFYRMPFDTNFQVSGQYDYEYQLSRHKNSDNTSIWLIKHRGNSLSLHEIEIKVFDEDNYHYGLMHIQKKHLSVLMSLGGMSVHSENCFNITYHTNILPRSSYKEWSQKIMNHDSTREA